MLNRIFFQSMLVLLLAPSFFNFSYAQSSTVSFTSLNTKQGLSSNTVNSILKDRYSLMWFATDDGLNKFDGTSFSVYRHNPLDSASIPSNRVTTLFEDKSGTLWIGTEEGNVCTYDRRRNKFRAVLQLKSRINAMMQDAGGKIWIGNYGGLCLIDADGTNRFSFPEQPAAADARLRSSVTAVISLYRDKQNRVWIGTKGGLYQFDRGIKRFIRYQFASGEPGAVSGVVIKAIVQDKYGRLWIGSNRGLSVIEDNNKESKYDVHYPRDSSNVSSNNIYALAADDAGKVWIGTEDGLKILDTGTGLISRYYSDVRNVNSISSNSIRSICIDNKLGIYWVGSYQGGINKYDKNLALFHWKQSNPFDLRGLPAPRVTAFSALNNNEIYVATDGGGLQLYNRSTGLFNRIPLPSSVSKLMALEVTRNKDLWIASYGHGLFLLDHRTGSFSHFSKGTGASDLSNNDIFCLKEDRKGKIWIGTNGGGLNVYDPRTRTFAKYSADRGKDSPFYLPVNGFIREIAEDSSGRIWIGSHGSGIAVYDLAVGRFMKKYSISDGLSNNLIMAILCDRRNNIWVGTAGGGLNFLNRRTNRFAVLSENHGLANDVIYKLLEQDQGKLWLSTNAGISSFDIRKKKFINYNKYNGVQNNNFLRGSGLRLPDGQIFFGGLEGFNYFHPSDLIKNENVPSVLLTDLKIEGRSVSPGNSIIDEHISWAKEINLDYKQNFSLSFAGISYTAPQQNQYSYKLEGFNKDWSRPGFSHTASYTNLDPGTYTFRVRACNNDGVWNKEGASIRIVVKPPFWRTTYAYLFYTLAIIGLYFYSRHRTMKRLEAKFMIEQERSQAAHLLEQERKEAERIRDLDNLKIKFLTNLSHEFRTPISLILGPIDNLLSAEDDKRKSGQLTMVKRNARRLLNLVNQLLDFRKMEEHELKLNPAEGDIISFVKDVADSFSDLSERKKINFSLNSSVGSLATRFDHDKIERILFNLLSNAFKFTLPDGTICLQIDQLRKPEEDSAIWLNITVSDSGIGIPEDKIEKIFERFFQNSTSAAILNQGSGIGLSITHEFVKMMGGTIKVESEPGMGAAFTISLPFVPLDISETAVSHDHVEQAAEEVIDTEDIQQIELSTGQQEILSVLLVEDNDDFRFYLKDNLKEHYRVLEASNGREGWQRALAGHPHIIVSDVNMPQMDGIELSRKVRSDKRTSHIPIILLTALTAEEEQIKGLATGANDYMTKPFNFEILHSKIKNLITLNRTLKDAYTKQIKVVATDVEIESEDAKLINKVLLYIEEHIDNPKISVEDLSRHLGMSRSTLYNKIMEMTGESPVEYIRNVKLDKAAVLLEKSALPIAQVGYATGFATPNYFSKSFKARFGVLPSEYMNQKRGAAGVRN